MHPTICETVQLESYDDQRTSVDIGLIGGVALGEVLGLAVTAAMALLVRGFCAGKGASFRPSDECTARAMDTIHSEAVLMSLVPPVFDETVPAFSDRLLVRTVVLSLCQCLFMKLS
jgi:hypothetical protein